RYSTHPTTPLLSCSFFSLMTPRPPSSTLFPYTTLFRSNFFSSGWHLHESLLSRTGGHNAFASEDDYLSETGRQFVAGLIEHELRSEEHTSELQSLTKIVFRLLLEKKKTKI